MWYIYDDAGGEWLTVGIYGQPVFRTKEEQRAFIRFLAQNHYELYKLNPRMLRPVKG